MQKKSDNKAFTFVELIVVTIILGILGTIGFSQFIGNISSGRDTLRKSHISDISGAMKTYKQTKGAYPIPAEAFTGTNNGKTVFWQGKLDKDVSLSTIEEIPYDPVSKIPYIYSITANKQEFDIALTLENGDGEFPLALAKGNYKSVAKNVLPTILLATGSTNSVDIQSNNNLFIFNNQSHNLPYDFDGNLEPVSDGELTFDELLEEAELNGVFSQNSSFEKCLEIRKAGKSIGNGEYQIRTNTGALTNTGCTGM